MSERGRYIPPEARTFMALGALAITYTASRGDNHSRVHKELARVALCAEAVTVVFGFGESKLSRTVSSVGLGTTALCFAAVALTDIHIVNHFQSERRFTGPDLLDLGQKFFSDFKRHTRIG